MNFLGFYICFFGIKSNNAFDFRPWYMAERINIYQNFSIYVIEVLILNKGLFSYIVTSLMVPVQVTGCALYPKPIGTETANGVTTVFVCLDYLTVFN